MPQRTRARRLETEQVSHCLRNGTDAVINDSLMKMDFMAALAGNCERHSLPLGFIGLWLMVFAGVAGAAAATKHGHAMDDVPCSWNVPIERPNHELDVDATIRLLKANHFTCYVQPIEEHSPMAYQDFLNLLPAAQRGGINVWAVLIPHTEGFSLPYREDFVRWMQELAKLSLNYPALRGVNIDDIDAGGNDRTFTRDYMCEINRAKRALNPKLLFIPTIYDLDRDEANRYSGCIDGVWLWWVNLEQNNGLRAFIRDGRAMVHGRFPVYAGVYAHSTSWHKQEGPKPDILKIALDIGCKYSDGVIVWQLPLTVEENPWLKIVREFTADGSSEFAGHCGQGVN
jgi:hypothetical protein